MINFTFYTIVDETNDVTSVPMCFSTVTDATKQFKDFVNNSVQYFKEDCPVYSLCKSFTYSFSSRLEDFKVDILNEIIAKGSYINAINSCSDLNVQFFTFPIIESVEDKQSLFQLEEEDENE